MEYLFVLEGIVDLPITAIDTTLIKAKGSTWHKSSIMEKGEVPCPGIDTDAKWGYSHTKGWVFGYKLHLTSTTTKAAGKEIVIPLAADLTTANVQDNQMYVPLTSSFPSVFSLPFVCYMVADPGYDDKNLYKYSKKVFGNRPDLSCRKI